MATIYISVRPYCYDESTEDFIYPFDRLSLFTALKPKGVNALIFFGGYADEGYSERLSDIFNIRSWLEMRCIYKKEPKQKMDDDYEFLNEIEKKATNNCKIFKTKSYSLDEFFDLPKIRNINDVITHFYESKPDGELEKVPYNERFKDYLSDRAKLKEYYEKEWCLKKDKYIFNAEFLDESPDANDINEAFSNLNEFCIYLSYLEDSPSIEIGAPSLKVFRDKIDHEFYARILYEQNEENFDSEMRHWDEMSRNEEDSMDRETDGFWRDI